MKKSFFLRLFTSNPEYTRLVKELASENPDIRLLDFPMSKSSETEKPELIIWDLENDAWNPGGGEIILQKGQEQEILYLYSQKMTGDSPPLPLVTDSMELLFEPLVNDQLRRRIQYHFHQFLSEVKRQQKHLNWTSFGHDLRSPLNAILGFSRFLEKDPSLPEPAKNKARTIYTSGEKLLNVINEVMESILLEPGQSDPQFAKPPSKNPEDLRPLTLVVDDQKSNRDLLRELLETRGYNVLQASNGEEALDIFRTQNPGIIFMDLYMPGLSGIEVTKKLREQGSGKKSVILGVSATSSPDEKEAFIQAGADGILPKPLREQDLETALEHFFPEIPPRESGQNSRGLEHMPIPWCHDFQTALASGSISQLRVLAQSAMETDPELGNYINKLVNNYDLAALKQLQLDGRKEHHVQ